MKELLITVDRDIQEAWSLTRWDNVEIGTVRRINEIIAYDEDEKKFYKIVEKQVCIAVGYPDHKWRWVKEKFPIEMNAERLKRLIEKAPPDNPYKKILDFYFLEKNLTDYLLHARKRTPRRWKELFQFLKLIFPNPHPASAFGEWGFDWEHEKKRKRLSYRELLVRIRDEAQKNVPEWFRQMCEEVGL